ncbi:hypothetical protein TBLA_0D01700 [Henningerozyma blattae CBS 6284]|uniref:N-alpha-acetyltransferase, 35 NatC auxiliary subunit n=1 Tax=Henningerozyma blattae (strain ATCC 34711 / CBS 6284 / DSM 70876 / NBRC 10599 / NRRL Y-10934 / UCD 77-7) TaxID=1071380 RepID=I2H2S6_HENB6|nr:hypothetical protein TBLA_0D01700 [Tetrapisispora blattae CBS 6284]CCH60678.1 hypothetical protein TBLA_0D01700 [Tetrapisispora blattae CBS 6284]
MNHKNHNLENTNDAICRDNKQNDTAGKKPLLSFNDRPTSFAQINNMNLIDVTAVFDNLCKDLPARAIIKSSEFDLFEGTHSLEVHNEKLDSSMINLTDKEVLFDCNIPYGESDEDKLKIVSGICDRLVRSIISWLSDYQILPSTVLSCRYIEHILVESESHDKIRKLESGHFLYDEVLSSCVISVAYFAKFVLELLKSGVIYEEEDLNFHTMGLNFFSYINNSNEIQESLNKSITLLRESSLAADFLIDLLNLLNNLVQIKTHITEYSTSTDHLESLKEIALTLSKKQPLNFPEIEGAFTMGIQKRMDNPFPPRDLVVPPSNNYINFVTLADDIGLILKVAQSESTIEIYQFSKFFNKLTQRHVLARAIFPLFLIRNDQTILGTMRIDEFVRSHIEEFSLFATNKEEDYVQYDSGIKIEEALQEGINVIFEMYQNFSQNTCRYAQGFNRQVKLWDSLQAHFEEAEYAITAEGLSDKIEETNNEFYPYAVWAYCMKLKIMCDLLLKGFDLELYKPNEICFLFWYIYYLQFHLQACLKDIDKFISAKIAHINNMPKRIKKVKAGPKKEKLKTEYQIIKETKLPQLKSNLAYVKYLLKETIIMQSLANIEIFQFILFKERKLVDMEYKLSDTMRFTNQQLMHNLRFKPFSSIAAPELFNYEGFLSNLTWIDEYQSLGGDQGIMNRINLELGTINVEVQNILDEISNCAESVDNEIYTGTRLVQEEAMEYYKGIQLAAKAIKISMSVSLAKMNKEKDPSELKNLYRLQLTHAETGSTYFPLMTLSPKTHWTKQDIQTSV